MGDEKTVMANEMTLFDYFAAKAMAAIITNSPDCDELEYRNAAENAYCFAFAMLKERQTWKHENESS